MKSSIHDCKIIKLAQVSSANGDLVHLEGNREIPFDIKRIYYIYNADQNAVRGRHAHKSLEQVVVSLTGSATFKVNDGKEEKTFVLDKPDEGLFVPNGIWKELYNFEKGTICLLIASKVYDNQDYISDFGKFKHYKSLGEEEYGEKYKCLSWEWLNDPEIKTLTGTPDFTDAEQAAFFKSLPDREDYLCWGITYDGLPIGLYALKNIEKQQGDILLILGEKDYWNKGLGILLLDKLIEKARAKQWVSVNLQVEENNKRAIRLYENYGFRRIGHEGGRDKFQLQLI